MVKYFQNNSLEMGSICLALNANSECEDKVL